MFENKRLSMLVESLQQLVALGKARLSTVMERGRRGQEPISTLVESGPYECALEDLSTIRFAGKAQLPTRVESGPKVIALE